MNLEANQTKFMNYMDGTIQLWQKYYADIESSADSETLRKMAKFITTIQGITEYRDYLRVLADYHFNEDY